MNKATAIAILFFHGAFVSFEFIWSEAYCLLVLMTRYDDIEGHNQVQVCCLHTPYTKDPN